MKLSLKLRSVVRLDDLGSKREPREGIIDELDRSSLVEFFIDLQNPEPGAVIYSRILIIVLPGSRDFLQELNVYLKPVPRLRLLISFPALEVPFVALVGW